MGHISGTCELLLREYWRKSMIIGETAVEQDDFSEKVCIRNKKSCILFFLLLYIIIPNKQQTYRFNIYVFKLTLLFLLVTSQFVLRQIDWSGLTKPGEMGDFFILVSMKSPNFCQKAKFQSF
jgi:hypothetical protein